MQRRRRRYDASQKRISFLYTAVIVLSVILLVLCGCGIMLHQANNGTEPGSTTNAATTGTTGATDPTDGTQPDGNGGDIQVTPTWKTGYIASVNTTAPYCDANSNVLGVLLRGAEVEYLENAEGPIQVRCNGQTVYLQEGASVVATLAEIIPEHTLYVKSAVNLRDKNGKLLAPLAGKGDSVKVTGYDYMASDGTAHMYQVELEGETGYIMPWYVVDNEEDALVNYDHNGTYTNNHSQRGNRFGGGGAADLDYFPREKADFADNVMPDECRTLYVVSWKLGEIDSYIQLAKECGINAFVVDIMDGSAIGYQSEVMKQYSPSTVDYAAMTAQQYAAGIKKIKDAGFYVIGRITAFNDYFFAVDNKTDHPDAVITGTDGKPLSLGGTYWPSGYSRLAWQYKVDLAIEAVELMGFDEIQYDYVRFPDLTSSYESAGTINYHNTYGETKAQAIQRFLMYATDILHEYGVYVSADVFGETCNNYVAAYGQYWPAISNVVDVISGMPYPDHWAKEGDFIPWENPYYTIARWGRSAMSRQAETATPAIIRTWIQTYDTNWKKPYVTYDTSMVYAQIEALRDTGCTGGFMTWNGSSSLSKYTAVSGAFGPEKK